MSLSPNTDAAEPDLDASIFRATKKRKINQRQRQERSPSPPASNASAANTPRNGILETESTGAELLTRDDPAEQLSIPHLRGAKLRRRVGGIEFSANASKRSVPASDALDASSTARGADAEAENEGESEILSLSSRFAPPTGVMRKREDEEKYLSAYIDSQLKSSSSQTADSALGTHEATPASVSASASASASARVQTQALPAAKQPALIGKLQEIDLGPSSRRRNEKATLKASRALGLAADTNHASRSAADARESQDQDGNDDASDDDEDDDEDGSQRKKKKLPPKVRVNRYGRVLLPRKPRRTKERSKEDIERDRMVEEMLRTSGGGNGASASTSRTGDGMGGGNGDLGRDGERERDEELVEMFRRDFVENVANAGARSVAAASSGGGGVGGVGKGRKDEVKAWGPKMGGSRSARYQMQQNAQRGR